MTKVRCNLCSGDYDLESVKTVAHYADCTVFITPCCNRTVDDRTWVSRPAFSEIGQIVEQWQEDDGTVCTIRTGPNKSIIFTKEDVDGSKLPR